jgi:cell division septal protein FtsQ
MPLRKSLGFSGKWSLSFKAKRFFHRLKIIMPFFLLIIIAAGLLFFLQSDFWTIIKVSCFYERGICPSDIYGDLSSLAIGQHLIFVPEKRINAAITDRYPFVKGIKIIKKFPPELQFNLFTREPLAAIVKQLQFSQSEASASADQSWLTGNEYFLVDEEGYILRKDNITDLPLILVQELPSESIGQQVGQKAVLKALEIITGLKLNLFEPEVALVNDFNIEFKLKDKVKVIFSAFDSTDSQINPLQFILSRAKIEGRKIRQIDLRFDKPVVIYD